MDLDTDVDDVGMVPGRSACTAGPSGPRAFGSPLETGRSLDQSPDILVKSAEIT